MLTLEGTKFQYLTGVSDPETISPDGYTLDQHYLEQPGRKADVVQLLLDTSPTSTSTPRGRSGSGGHRHQPKSFGDARIRCSWKPGPALT